ncbi:MAG: MBL fold metallo-hydrolase [Phycisphaerae bacterium]|nr:MBL fold metallo-hydrolase [Phycisphaerae bacterium]
MRLLRAGHFKLDGGSMFGLIPRSVWSRSVASDDRGRITVQHNCLLLERHGTPPPGEFSPRLVLIETGSGNKLDRKSRDIFDLEERSILEALHEVDCRPEDIEAAVVTHLHFDHAGGLTRLTRPGESGGEYGAVSSFPNARIYAQHTEWEDALANRSVMTRTYFRSHLDPIRVQVTTTDSPRPFASGYKPGREELPPTPVELRLTPIFPGLEVFLVPGHTWGQQAITFTDTDGRTIVFTPDVMPTIHHVGAAYSLGYDVEPFTSMVSRHWFLEDACVNRWTLVLDHEPGHPVHRVKRNDRGWFDLEPA